VNQYKRFFQVAKHNVCATAYQYICGLLQAENSNISAMCEAVVGSQYERLHHFIHDSPWSACDVKRQIAADAVAAFAPLSGESALLIDEYSCRKQGKSSVGVARQYLGCMGKVDSGQVAVLATLSQKIYTIIIATRLFLPEEWTKDSARMDKAGVPEAERVFQTKPEIAAAMIARLHAEGVRWSFINADGLYGNSTAFRRSIDAISQYVVFVHSTQTVYPHEPAIGVPERTSTRGRAPSLLRTPQFHQTIAEFVAEQPDSAWQTIQYGEGSKGAQRRQVLSAMVWTWNGEEQRAVKERVVASRRMDKSDVQYSLSNDREGKQSLYRCLVRQMQRAWVERSIRDAKQELGLTDYQVRSWTAWEHHCALTMLALLFLTQERIANKRGLPLLSCADVRDLLVQLLPCYHGDSDAAWRMITERHKLRAADKAAAKRRSSP
jgi:SRSO17 transposase